MGWKDEIRDGPIQAAAAIVALIGALVTAGLYFWGGGEDPVDQVSVQQDVGEDSKSRLKIEVELPDLPPPPPLEEGKLPPRPPFMQEEQAGD